MGVGVGGGGGMGGGETRGASVISGAGKCI